VHSSPRLLQRTSSIDSQASLQEGLAGQQDAELAVAALAKQRQLAAELEAERAAAVAARREAEKAREQKASNKQQLAAIKAELAEVRKAHSCALASAAQLDSDFGLLRQENAEVTDWDSCTLPWR
jgi:hypothetical protein